MTHGCPACGFEAPGDAARCPECGAAFDVDLPEEWLTVFAGSMSEVLALQAALEDAEVPTFVPDAMTKVIDPFITGGNVFEVRLQVPAREHRRAVEVLQELRERASERSEEALDEEPEDEEAAEPSTSSDEAPDESASFADDDVAILARRIRWSAVLFITAPFGLFWGLRYARLSRGRTPRPAGHGLTIAAVWLCLFEVLAIAYVLGTGFGCVLRDSNPFGPSGHR